MYVQSIISYILIDRLNKKLLFPTNYHPKYIEDYKSAINDCIQVVIKFKTGFLSNEMYYTNLQNKLSKLIRCKASTNRQESYNNGVLCAKSILHELYNKERMNY